MNFTRHYLQMFTKPASTFELLFQSKSKVKYGLLAFLIPSVGYTLFYIMAWNAGGSPSTFKPWLNLPIEEYFRYDIFLTLPGYFVSWMVASGTVFLLSHLLRGKATYEDALVTIGFGLGVATWSSMFHDLSDAVLSVLGVIDMREYERLLNEPTFWRYMLLTLYVIYFAWFITLFTIGVKKANGFGWFKSVLIALVGLVTFQTTLLIFIR